MEKIKAGIIGGAGYTAGELLRLLIHHPHIDEIALQSESQAGKPVTNVHTDLVGECETKFVGAIDPSLDVVFLCKGHGQSKEFLEKNSRFLDARIIDLSQDFRLSDPSHDFVYGLPELYKEKIKRTRHIANPGCFATAIQLAILPAVKAGLVEGDIHLSGLTGSTGAGQSFSQTSHFSWRFGNTSVYKALDHQHMLEVEESTAAVGSSFEGRINFIPYRGAFTRGIIVTAYFDTNAEIDILKGSYSDFYSDAVFTHVVDSNPDLKMVLNTNKGIVYVSKKGNQAIVVSVIDNLLKGASGQAVQNMNLIFGWDEKTGLQLKPSGF